MPQAVGRPGDVSRRCSRVFCCQQFLAAFPAVHRLERFAGASAPGMGRLGIAPSSIATIRATARLRLSNGQYSDLRRTVTAMVKFLGNDWNPPFHVMRWYDTSVSPSVSPQ